MHWVTGWRGFASYQYQLKDARDLPDGYSEELQGTAEPCMTFAGYRMETSFFRRRNKSKRKESSSRGKLNGSLAGAFAVWHDPTVRMDNGTCERMPGSQCTLPLRKGVFRPIIAGVGGDRARAEVAVIS